MPIKTILVPFSNVAGQCDGGVIEPAAALARRLGAHLTALHVRPDPHDLLPYATIGLTGKMADSIIEAATRSADEEATRLRGEFEALCARLELPLAANPGEADGASAEWREASGRESAVVARHGRLADLVVFCRPSAESPAPATLEAALLETGRPILVVPPGYGGTIGASVAIGWNGSAEAAAAVAAAMPFLGQAASVTVLSTSEGAELKLPPEDLAGHLAWHGIAAKVRSFDSGSAPVGGALLAEAKAGGADLLVMGGYGHSRRRELVLGGVTRHVLTQGDMPVLMVH